MAQVVKLTSSGTGKDSAPEVAGIDGLVHILSQMVGEVGGFLKMLLQAATINPFMAGITALILADLLFKAKIITAGTRGLIQTVTLIYVGIDITDNIASLVSSFIQDLDPTDLLKGITGSPTTQALAPTVDVVNFQESSSTPALDAYLAKLASK